jgi:plasmid stabilization system protein ParE
MEALRIIWKKQALRRVEEIAQWYEDNMGYTAERHFLEGIADVVHTLS